MKKKGVSAKLRTVVVAGVAALAITGCDYWPPALQAQIEQLRNEAKQAAVDRAALEEQLNAAVRLRDELQAKADELTKSNQELAARVANLEQSLVAERQKMAKKVQTATKSMAKAGVKTSPNASAKAASKAAAKKKATKTKASKTSVKASEKSTSKD